MQLCHLDCLDVEGGEGEKCTQSLPFVYQENKGLKLPLTAALSPVFSPSRTNKCALIACLGHIHKQSRQHGSAEMGQDKSGLFLLSITR